MAEKPPQDFFFVLMAIDVPTECIFLSNVTPGAWLKDSYF